MLVASDGQGPGNPDDLIDQHLPAGTYYLTVEVISGTGDYALTLGHAAAFSTDRTSTES